MDWNLSRFAEVASNVLTSPQVRTPKLLLGKTIFTDNGRKVVALQQNPNKDTSYGELARSGHEVVQFIEESTKEYIAVAVNGKVTPYNNK